MGKSIGEGTFGKVKMGTHTLTGEKVAIKILEKERITDVSDVERVAREIHILKLIRLPPNPCDQIICFPVVCKVYWIINKFNIEYPTEFVLETHKKLRIEIEKLVTPPEHDDSFPSLIRTAKQANNGDGIYQTSQRGEIIDVYNALHRLNKLRNELAHPAVNNSKKILYGMMYASIFVEIWEKVKQDD